ncbi:GTP-binding protein [Desulfobotulus alkaliphilus]|uniref:GTPase Obg n=1 Tax=Desulfobotulus alkaliphilus TaxID=622671 RepID=A0A562R4E0_9BACT|nr:GTPase ObgE [Desulfobotulus alkaliphilus]TWI63919.1 GTP-binding protein [Desulfobotulus alkaliphilus]
MKFVDEAEITVESGHGGRGCVSFRREKFIPKGGPDGGDGGDGGDVILKASDAKRTLYRFRHREHHAAERGRPGEGSNCSGRRGQDLVLEVPTGTVVWNSETGERICDLDTPDSTFLLARGGRGGKGNRHFMTSTHQAPRFAQPGTEGEYLFLRLELKLIADVGIIGFPNAGKSTLIRAISAAKPKVADYPFTTLVPNLGVVSPPWGEPFVVADIPGLIEGAHEGVGLGHRFLRHVERTRILVHVIDAMEMAPENPLHAFETINRELKLYSEKLAGKPQLVVLNKMDIPEAREKALRFKDLFSPYRVVGISAATGKNLDTFLELLTREINSEDDG